ncbi:MAG: ShlB/FhaC/HecB family hemolysin secretion/activation protein [Methylophaga sp.]|nr:ShlB/FhaC/HecB family hemolysin secretion/activation protein [Methylophaga sp.]
MKKTSLLITFILNLPLSFSSLAVEPPFIVEEPEPEQLEKKEAEVDVPSGESLSTAKDVKKIRVNKVQFQGGTVFELEALAEMVRPLIGKDVSKTDIVRVLRGITQQYTDAGYALSFAFLPKQSTADGVLTIVLVEGYIARKEIVIEDEDVRARVEKLAARMEGEKPLTNATFERYVKLIEATPGYKFKIRVPKPKTIGGGTTVRVEEVSADWFDTSLGFDDSKEEELKLLPGVSFNSLTSFGDKLTLTTLVPNDTVKEYYALNYQQDIGSDGLRFELAANHFESEGDDRIFVADVPLNYEENKERDSLRAGVKYPLLLSKKSSWWVGTNLHYLDENALYELQREDGQGDAVEIEKELRYSALELHSSWTKQLTRQIFRLSGSVKQGIELGSSKNSISNANGTRSGSETIHFNTVRLDGLWRFLLSPKWRIQTKANLFWSDDILPSAEQIRYGGPRYGRGYPDGQAQGDKGMAGEFEIRYLQAIPMRVIKRIEPYIVLDAAKTKLRASDREQELVSAAIGVDITDTNTYTVGLEYAKPLGDAHFETEDRSPIYNIKLRWQF